MSDFIVPFAKQELLHHMLQVGGKATCPLSRHNGAISADLEVLFEGLTTRVRVQIAGHSGELTLSRGTPGNHIRLRDFLEDMANGRHESGRLREANTCPTVSTDDLAELKQVVEQGGSRQLSTGHIVSVHRGRRAATGIVTRVEETHLVSGPPNAVLAGLTEHIEIDLAS